MSAQAKVSGTWRSMMAPYIKVSGTWKMAKTAWTKIDGVWKNWFSQGGFLENSFIEQSSPTFNNNLGVGFKNGVLTLAVQEDQKIVVGGSFSSHDSLARNNISRINSDGTRDTSFATAVGTGLNNTVRKIAIQSDGKIVAVGFFTTHNGVSSNRIARLNSDGTRDTAFTTAIGTGFNNGAYTVAIQSDGKILVGGEFVIFNGVAVNRIVRLNPNGTLDTDFSAATGTGFDSSVKSIAIQSDGKILVGGTFQFFNGSRRLGIVRLNSDGTRDTSFVTTTLINDNVIVQTISVQSDGKIFVGGFFSIFNGTLYDISYALRHNSNGTLDNTFEAVFDSEVQGSFIQPDGKIIVYGDFTSCNFIDSNYIARLNSNGSTDTLFASNIGIAADIPVHQVALQSGDKIVVCGEFTTFKGSWSPNFIGLNLNGNPISLLNGANNEVIKLKIQADQKIVIGGDLTAFNGTRVRNIARLNKNGTLDTAFTTAGADGFNATVLALAIQSDAKIVAGGTFTTHNGVSSNCIARINIDGTRDTAFTTAIGTGFSGGQVSDLAIQTNQKIVVGGIFTTHNGVSSRSIARLNTDGTRDTAFTTAIGTGFNSIVNSLVVQADQKILVGGAFTTHNGTTSNRIARLNTDGTRDTAFTTAIGTGFNSIVQAITLQTDGKILVGGFFTGFNTTTFRRIARLNADGTLDTGFANNIGDAFDAAVEKIAVQADGKILVGGRFTSFNGITSNRIARLNSNGTLDTTFSANTGIGFNEIVRDLAVQADGEVLAVGDFITFNNVSKLRVARLSGNITG